MVVLLLLGACRGQTEPRPQSSPTRAETEAPPSPEPPPVPDEPALQEIGRFQEPIFVTSPAGDARLFVLERAGRLIVLENGAPRVQPYLDISDMVQAGGERGLFMIAFAPDYARSGLSYVHFTDRSGNTKVLEFKVSSDPNVADPASARELLSVVQPFSNHNGGPLLFDPTGMLILGLGDGGSGGDPQDNAQNLRTFLGKFLRINPRSPSEGRAYGIPSDNPFVGRDDASPEIWAYGLRNPWRISFDRETEDLWVGDVGQNRFEEINFVPPAAQSGANYGWPRFEGTELFKNRSIDESRLVMPVMTYPLDGNCAVTGGYVYRGEVNTLRGVYLYGDVCGGVVKGFRLGHGQVIGHKDYFEVPRLASFGEDSGGQVYAVSLTGPVYKIVKK
ncbi:MAG: PQQ-dependent sugar dehydrogenase [Actinobacteria bacterium]|nr:PQQ-dependent sugar dehydrogenase [Actinomycetota bacterium]